MALLSRGNLMSAPKTDLLFHPIRARIIVEISGGRQSAKELAETMPNVPKTTLYRHIRALADGGILEVVEEIPIRGTVERVYALNMAAVDPDPAELDQMTREDYEQAFALYVTGSLADFTRYLDSNGVEKIDVVADGLKFGLLATTMMACPHLDEEVAFTSFLEGVGQFLILGESLVLSAESGDVARFTAVHVE